jgi:hypothetical protein
MLTISLDYVSTTQHNGITAMHVLSPGVFLKPVSLAVSLVCRSSERPLRTISFPLREVAALPSPLGLVTFASCAQLAAA